jgi:hypothetical protein
VNIAGTVPISIANVVPVSSQAPQLINDAAGTITATTIGATITVGLGQSYQTTIIVSSITGALAQSIVRIQESPDNGVNWRTVYTFEPITVANGARSYKSAVLAITGNRIRYVETVTGITSSITRNIVRSTITTPGLVNQDTRSTNIVNAAFAPVDIPAYGVIRAITVHSSVAPLWLQFHDSLVPVAAGAIPRQSIPISSSAGTILGHNYFGAGRLLPGNNPRVVISNSAFVYTAISFVDANALQLYIEAI